MDDHLIDFIPHFQEYEECEKSIEKYVEKAIVRQNPATSALLAETDRMNKATKKADDRLKRAQKQFEAAQRELKSAKSNFHTTKEQARVNIQQAKDQLINTFRACMHVGNPTYSMPYVCCLTHGLRIRNGLVKRWTKGCKL